MVRMDSFVKVGKGLEGYEHGCKENQEVPSSS